MGRKLFWDATRIQLLKQNLHKSNEAIAKMFNTTVNAIKRVKNDHKMKKNIY